MSEYSYDKRSGMLASEWAPNTASIKGKEPLQPSSLAPEPSEEFLKRTGSWSVLRASGRYHVPNTHISNLGVIDQGGSREVFALGSGLTSEVVKHVTDESTENILPRNSTIAVKIFRDKPNLPRDTRRALFDIILREIEAFGHPALSNHENLVKLLFIGWIQSASVPALAMELGEYGSLDYVLKNPEYGLNFTNKRHVTIDIALGLDAIYQAGFIHGDVKPDNIILTNIAETNRDVVAKLTDFGGSGQIDNGTLGKPLHFTPHWSAPEAQNQDHNTDWARADVYSWGLIVASIWAQSDDGYGTDSGSHDFLSAQVPDGLEGDEKMNLLEYWKSDNNILVPLKDRLSHLAIANNTLKELLKALHLSLQTSPLERPNTKGLVHQLETLMAGADRKIPKDNGIAQSVKETEYDHSSHFLSWDRSSAYAGILHEQMLLGIKEIDDLGYHEIKIIDLPLELDENISSADYIGFMRSSIDAVVKEGMSKTTRWVDLEMKGLFAAYLFFWKLVRPTSPQDVAEGLEMLRTGAINGNSRAICLYAPALADTNNDREFPSLLYLSLLAMAHSDWAMEVLASCHPSHYIRVRSIIRERSTAWEETKWKFGKRHDPFLLATFLAYATHPPSLEPPASLGEAIEIGTVYDIRGFLQDLAADDTSNSRNTELLHLLARRPDIEAAELAEEIYSSGVVLSHLASVSAAVDPGQDTFTWLPSSLSPLSAALKKGKPQLASTILRLHFDHEQPIVDFHCAVAISCGQLDHKSTAALLRFHQERPNLCYEGPEPWNPTVERLSRLLWFAMDIDLTLSLNLERRAMLGSAHSHARQMTMKLLLREGANPVDGQAQETPLAAALRVDDIVSVKLFLQHLSGSGQNILEWINDMSGEGISLSAAFFCVHFNSFQCFEYLLQEYLEYMLADRDSAGMTLLHVACEQSSVRDADAKIRPGNIKFVQLMLAKGFDVLATTDSGQTPLFLALRSGNIAAADEIMRHVSTEHSRQLMFVAGDVPILAPLMAGWKDQRSQQALASIDWVLAHDGAHVSSPEPSLLRHFGTACIKGIRPSSKLAQALDSELLIRLLKTPRILNTFDLEGPKLLLTAVCGGHVDIVKTLISRNVNLDEVLDPKKFSSMPVPEALTRIQLTVHDMARLMQCGHIPPEIARGGYLEVQEWRQDIDAIVKLLAIHKAQSPMFDAMLQHKSLESIQSAFARNFMDKDLNERLKGKLQALGLIKKRTVQSTFWPAPIPQHSSLQAGPSGSNSPSGSSGTQPEWQEQQRMLQKLFNPQGKDKLKERCDHRHAAWCNVCDNTIYGVWYKCLDCEDFDYCEDCAESQMSRHPNHKVRLVRCKCKARAARKANTVLGGLLAENYKGAVPAVWPVPPS